jgi:hypothetical protein
MAADAEAMNSLRVTMTSLRDLRTTCTNTGIDGFSDRFQAARAGARGYPATPRPS